MSACGYNCPGCANCNDGYGLVASRDNDAWGSDYGGMQPDFDIDQSISVLDELLAGLDEHFPEAGIPESVGAPPQGGEPQGGGQPRRPDLGGDQSESARTPISLGDAAVMGAGGVFLGKLLAKVFGR